MQDIIDLLKEIWDLHRLRLRQQRQAIETIRRQNDAIDALVKRIKDLEAGR